MQRGMRACPRCRMSSVFTVMQGLTHQQQHILFRSGAGSFSPCLHSTVQTAKEQYSRECSPLFQLDPILCGNSLTLLPLSAASFVVNASLLQEVMSCL